MQWNYASRVSPYAFMVQSALKKTQILHPLSNVTCPRPQRETRSAPLAATTGPCPPLSAVMSDRAIDCTRIRGSPCHVEHGMMNEHSKKKIRVCCTCPQYPARQFPLTSFLSIAGDCWIP